MNNLPGTKRTIPLPLLSENWAALTIVTPVPSADWDHLIRLLDVMRPALVGDDAAANDDDPSKETG